MKKHILITTLFAISSLILSGCMTTWPIVDDLDHYQKWDTYESIREKNNEESTVINENVEEEVVEENLEDESNDTDNTEISEDNEGQIIEDTEEIE